MATTLVWLRQDLRLSDNPALYHAASTKDSIIPIYIYDEIVPQQWQIGGAQRWWLHHSLTKLSEQFAKKGMALILRRGDPKKILPEIIKATQANAIYWNRCYEPYARQLELALQNKLASLNIEVKSFEGNLLFEPNAIKNQQGSYYKVFNAFWRACLSSHEPGTPLAIPKLSTHSQKKIHSDQLSDWQLLPTKPNWAKNWGKLWVIGELAAQKKLTRFLENQLNNYAEARDIPNIDGTSLLSPHLHFGEISPRQIWYATKQALMHASKSHRHAERFLAEIGWREFSYYLLYHFPKLPEQPFQHKFSGFAWRYNKKDLQAWQRGLTGYPIVDAGMRQLWQTGWMHNRVRMIVASFLTKDLLIPWQQGEAWFWDTLVDADLASNSASWQWVAGSGADAAPYFRIFNPSLQGKKFDPEGEYVRRWIPELAKLPNKFTHTPWQATSEILLKAGIRLGTDYPRPIVDHDISRKTSLELFKQLKIN
jgi:deoxyribodipyrimidine photo-lyase